MLVGPSGCGKTTLPSVIAGLLDSNGGDLEVLGEMPAQMSGQERILFRRRHLGFVFQQYNLLPALTAAENVAVPLLAAGVNRIEAVAQAKRLLAQLRMEERAASPPAQLSGGQQQRVGRQATQLHDLTLGLGNFFSAGPGISLPLFNGGRIRSNIAVQTSRQRGTVISYKSVILHALEEVENALIDYAQEQERRDRLNQAAQHSQLAVDLATEQYRAGLVDFLSVLEAQRELYANEDQLVQSQTSVTTHLIGLYRALGGGWTVALHP